MGNWASQEGQGEQQQQQATPAYVDDLELRLAPHNLYLVFGKPSIRFARERTHGPLLYDVEVEYDEDENVVEHAATLDLCCAVPRRQRFELVGALSGSPSVVPASRGYAVTFQIAMAQPPQRVRVYAGAQVEYRPGDGIHLRCGGGVAAASLCIFDTTDTQSLTSVVSNPLVLPQNLQPVKYETVPHLRAPTSVQRVTYAPIAIEVVVSEAVLPSRKRQKPKAGDADAREVPLSAPSVPLSSSPSPPLCVKRHMTHYTFLALPEDAAEQMSPHRDSRDTRGAPHITCQVVKQLLQVGSDVYELEDVFDDGREEDEHSPAGADSDEEGVCVVCLTNAKDTTILPCRHMCLCNECAIHLRLSNNRCPLCRGNIERVMTL